MQAVGAETVDDADVKVEGSKGTEITVDEIGVLFLGFEVEEGGTTRADADACDLAGVGTNSVDWGRKKE